MKPTLEHLEPRCTPSTTPIAHAEITTLGIGADPMTQFAQAMARDYLPLLGSYGVGGGSVVGSISLPDPGAITNAMIQADIVNAVNAGQIHPDANTYVAVTIPRNVTDSWAQQDSAYHSAVWVDNQWVRYGVVYSQSRETIPWTHELAEAAAGQEIADPYNWQSFSLDGYPVSEFALPGGAEYHPPVTQQVQQVTQGVWTVWQQELNALWAEWGALEQQFLSLETALWREYTRLL